MTPRVDGTRALRAPVACDVAVAPGTARRVTLEEMGSSLLRAWTACRHLRLRRERVSWRHPSALAASERIARVGAPSRRFEQSAEQLRRHRSCSVLFWLSTLLSANRGAVVGRSPSDQGTGPPNWNPPLRARTSPPVAIRTARSRGTESSAVIRQQKWIAPATPPHGGCVAPRPPGGPLGFLGTRPFQEPAQESA